MTIRESLLVTFSLIWMALSAILFLLTWFTPWVSLPLSLGILASIAFYWKKASRAQTDPWKLGKADLAKLLAVLPFFLVPYLFIGLAGHYPAHTDIFIFRQALYLNLIDAPWPLVLPDGREMSYYLAGMLPPAMASRFMPEGSAIQQWVLILWLLPPSILAFLLICHRHKRVSLLFALFLLFFLDIIQIIFPNQDCFTGRLVLYASHATGIPFDAIFMPKCSHSLFSLGQNSGALYATTAPLLLAALATATRTFRPLVIPLATALCLPLSPLGIIGIIPILLTTYFRIQGGGIRYFIKTRLPYLLLPCLLAFVFFLYYERGDFDSCFALLGTISSPKALIAGTARLVLCIALFALPVWGIHKRDPLFLVSAICPLLIYQIYIGSAPETGLPCYNELWLKSTCVYLMLLASYFAFSWKKATPWLRYIPLLFTCISTYYMSRHFMKYYRDSPNVRDIWNGHLAHQDDISLEQKIPVCKEPLVPGVLLRESGQSEQFLPSWLFPRASGCDYSRPPTEENTVFPSPKKAQ